MNSQGANVLNSMIQGVESAVVEIGRAGLHALGPENFEYYMCSLELFDGNMNSEAYMIFPVMPNNIMENKTQIASVNKTNTGIVTVFNPTFNPIDISLQGTFGRKLRLILGQKEFVGEATGSWAKAQKFFNGNIGINGGIGNTDVLIKTGYGMMKMMQHILDGAYQIDSNNGKPRILVFTNYAFNTSYVVEPLQKSFQQSTENNMMWFYNIELKAVANREDIVGKESVGKFIGKVAVGQISKFLDNLVHDCMRMIPL